MRPTSTTARLVIVQVLLTEQFLLQKFEELLLLMRRNSGVIMRSVPRGGILPYMCYIGMCCPNGCGFSAILVINRVLIFALSLF